MQVSLPSYNHIYFLIDLVYREFVEPPTKITKSVKPRPGSPEFRDHSPVTIIPMDVDEAGAGPSAQPDSTKRICKPTWKVLEGAVLDGAPESKKSGQVVDFTVDAEDSQRKIHTASAEESSDLDLFKPLSQSRTKARATHLTIQGHTFSEEERFLDGDTDNASLKNKGKQPQSSRQVDADEISSEPVQAHRHDLETSGVQAHAGKAPSLDSAYDSGPPKSMRPTKRSHVTTDDDLSGVEVHKGSQHRSSPHQRSSSHHGSRSHRRSSPHRRSRSCDRSTPHHCNKSSHPHTNDSSFDSLDGFIVRDDEDTSVHKSSRHREKSTHKQDHSEESDSSPVVKDRSHSDYQGKGKQPTCGCQSSMASESEEENIDVHPAKMSQNKHRKSRRAKHKTSSDEESDSSMAPSHRHKRNTKASSADSSDSASDGDGRKSRAVKKNNKKKKSTKRTDSSDRRAALLLPFFRLERDMQYNGIQNQQLLTFAPTLQAMNDDESARVLHRSQKFVSHGIYANPISADPEMFSINKTHIVHKPGNSNAVFILTGAVNECNLVSGALHGTGEGYLTKKLMLFIFEENFDHFAGFFGMVANFDEARCHFYGSSLLFATMKQGAGHGNGSRVLKNQAYFRNVPIYDGRGGRFNFKEKDFDNLQSLPLYRGGKKDLPPYAVVSVGFTFNVFHMQNDGVCASFNIMFIIYLGMTGNDGK
ncbi:hypothetical protein CPB84DRAFT_1748176 [Gymnopilus junonius]|uniref:Uncharacterized protein n=1 Tax=Gymnopilus junonius TaxID=109634 RepID=A0A9P5TL99_GYMJU|nr:hypothetical protein CPB84DRAFT_1748176 [Gymnopilus junonius]